MEIVKHVIFCVLIMIAFLKNTESASDNNTCGCKAPSGPGEAKLRTYGRQNRMYYEPRMGRLKRDVDSDETIMGDDRYESSFVNMIQDKPWTVITLSGKGQGGKRQSMTFTPRLGRKSSDDSSFTDPDPIEPPYFPRLGRTRVLFPPRLGRQLFYDANKQ